MLPISKPAEFLSSRARARKDGVVAFDAEVAGRGVIDFSLYEREMFFSLVARCALALDFRLKKEGRNFFIRAQEGIFAIAILLWLWLLFFL